MDKPTEALKIEPLSDEAIREKLEGLTDSYLPLGRRIAQKAEQNILEQLDAMVAEYFKASPWMVEEDWQELKKQAGGK